MALLTNSVNTVATALNAPAENARRRMLWLAGGAAAVAGTAGLLWYLLRDGDDEEADDSGSPGVINADGAVFYQVIDPKGCSIGIRQVPDVYGPRTGESIFPGQVFAVSEVIPAEGEQKYLRLADGRGFAFTISSKDGRLLAQEVSANGTNFDAAPQSGMQQMLLEMQKELQNNPALREQVMNSPEVQNALSNPDVLKAAAEGSASVAEALKARPLVAEALNNNPTELTDVLNQVK